MIETKELRLGNLVHFTNHEDTVFRVVMIDTYFIGVAGGPHFQDSSDLAIPIPLTKQWLVKLGFVNSYDRHFECARGRVFFHMNGKIEATINQSGLIDITAYHVHQLQNLYFALTGEELEVKV